MDRLHASPTSSRSTDIYLVPAAGGEEKKVTFDSADEIEPAVLGRRARSSTSSASRASSAAEAGPPSQLFCIPLEKLDKDPDEAEPRPTPTTPDPAEAAAEMRRRGGRARSAPPKEPKIDWAGLKRRTRQVTRTGSVFNYIPADDGKTLIFVGSEGGGRAAAAGRRAAVAAVDLHDPGRRQAA